MKAKVYPGHKKTACKLYISYKIKYFLLHLMPSIPTTTERHKYNDEVNKGIRKKSCAMVKKIIRKYLHMYSLQTGLIKTVITRVYNTL